MAVIVGIGAVFFNRKVENRRRRQAALRPAYRNFSDDKWVVVAGLDITRTDGSQQRLTIYRTGRSFAAFELDGVIYRGGSDQSIARALGAAYLASAEQGGQAPQ
jgi:hypothetical protein